MGLGRPGGDSDLGWRFHFGDFFFGQLLGFLEIDIGLLLFDPLGLGERAVGGEPGELVESRILEVVADVAPADVAAVAAEVGAGFADLVEELVDALGGAHRFSGELPFDALHDVADDGSHRLRRALGGLEFRIRDRGGV